MSTFNIIFKFVYCLRLISMADEIKFTINESDYQGCLLNSDHWKLIKWYFNRSTYVDATEITANRSKTSESTNELIRQLSIVTQTSIKINIVDYEYVEPITTIADQYSWNGQRFDSNYNNLSDDPNNSKTIRQIFSLPVKTNNHRIRSDEPTLAAIVLSDSLKVLRNYLVGTPRLPFYKSSGNFVILLTKKSTVDDWSGEAAYIMEILWRNYRVFNAIIILPCEDLQLIGYYDPFDRNPDIIDSTDWNGDWGAMRWIPLDEHDLDDGWILRKGANLRGYPFAVSIFSRYPTMVKKNQLPNTFLTNYYAEAFNYAAGYGGFDALVMGNMAKVLNFNLKIVHGHNYGGKLENGTFTGSIGDVLYRKAEASFNGRFIEDYETNEIDFLYPVFTDQFCVIAPAALPIPGWMAIFRCYSGFVWLCIFIIDFLSGLLWFFLKKIVIKYQKSAKDKNQNDSYILIDMFLIMCGSPSTKIPIRSLERIFIATCLIFNIIIVGTFQGSLTKSFSKIVYRKDIDTLVELDASGLPIVASNANLKLLFGNDDGTSLLKSLKSKFFIKNITAVEVAAFQRTMCAVERFSDSQIIIKTVYERPDGSPMVHIVRECPRDYHLSYIVKKGSPYVPRFKRILLKFFESGLLKKWYDEIQNALISHKLSQALTRRSPSLSLIDTQTAFYILGIGWFLCFAIFLMEIIVYKYY